MNPSLTYSTLSPADKETLLSKLGLTSGEVEFVINTQTLPMVTQAIKRIAQSPFSTAGMYVGHSGGKDSVLVRYLADNAVPDLPTIHSPKPTGEQNAVYPVTQEFLYGLKRPILYCPLECHSQFNLKTQIDGTRASEHDRSNGRAVDLVIDGKHVSREHMPLYLANGLFGINFIYPIFDWTDLQVWAAIFCLDIPFSLEYLLPKVSHV